MSVMACGRRTGVAASIVTTMLSVLAAAGDVVAEDRPPVTASLGWVRLPGAEGCITSRELGKRVESSLGRPALVSASQGDLAIEARVEPGKSGTWKVTIVTTPHDGGAIGTRELKIKGEACSAIDEPVALALAITIDPDAALAPKSVDVEKPPVATPPPVLAVAIASPSPPKVIVRDERVLVPVPSKVPDVDGDLRIAPQVAVGLLPHAALGLELGASLKTAFAWPIELSGGILTDSQTNGRDGGAVFSLGYGALAVCPTTRQSASDAWWISACVGTQVGVMRGRGFGFDEPRDSSATWVAAVGDVRLSARLTGPLFAQIGAGLLAAIVRPRFTYLAADGKPVDVFQEGSIAGRFQISLGFHFSS